MVIRHSRLKPAQNLKGPAMCASNLRASYRRAGETRWEGVLKDESGTVVWACGHRHKCRDYNHSQLFAHEGAAMFCANAEMKRRRAAA